MTWPSASLLSQERVTKLFRGYPLTTLHALLRSPHLLLPWPTRGCANDRQKTDGLNANLQKLLYCHGQSGRGFRLASKFVAHDTSWVLQLSRQGKVPVHRVEQSHKEKVSPRSGRPVSNSAPDDRPEPGCALDGREPRCKDVFRFSHVQALLRRKPAEALGCLDTLCGKFRQHGRAHWLIPPC